MNKTLCTITTRLKASTKSYQICDKSTKHHFNLHFMVEKYFRNQQENEFDENHLIIKLIMFSTLQQLAFVARQMKNRIRTNLHTYIQRDRQQNKSQFSEHGNECAAFRKFNWTFKLFTRLSLCVQITFTTVSTKPKAHKQMFILLTKPPRSHVKVQQQLEINCKRLTM